MPVPLSVTLCGLPPPLSLKSNDAVRAPVAVGVKVRFTVQLWFTPKVAPQVVVLEKSPAFTPRIPICHKFMVMVPLLVMVTACGELLVLTV